MTKAAFEDVKEEVKEKAEKVTEHTKKTLVWLARAGFAAKGFVYIVLSLLVTEAALGLSTADLDIQDALLEISGLPFGRPLLAAVAVGLLGYVIWKFTEAFYDPEEKGFTKGGLASRTAVAVSGISYAIVTLTALRFMTGAARSRDDSSQDIAVQVMTMPVGQVIIGLAGLVVIGVGIAQFYQAYAARFQKKIDAERQVRKVTKQIGRLGYLARGMIYTVTGLLLMQSALFRDPYLAGGIGKALRAIAFSTYGPWLLGSIAIGLLAYGVYSLLAALYYRFPIRMEE